MPRQTGFEIAGHSDIQLVRCATQYVDVRHLTTMPSSATGLCCLVHQSAVGQVPCTMSELVKNVMGECALRLQ